MKKLYILISFLFLILVSCTKEESFPIPKKENDTSTIIHGTRTEIYKIEVIDFIFIIFCFNVHYPFTPFCFVIYYTPKKKKLS